MMNVVGITLARGTEYQRAGSARFSFAAAGLSGVSTNASMCSPARMIWPTKVPGVVALDHNGYTLREDAYSRGPSVKYGVEIAY